MQIVEITVYSISVQLESALRKKEYKEEQIAQAYGILSEKKKKQKTPVIILASVIAVLTFYLEDKFIYLELTPQSGKPCYGKELVFDSEQSFMAGYINDGCEVIDVTDSVIIGEAPDFVLSRMD